MSSRRLDISSLLCSNDRPQQQHCPVAEPVVLAPHLRRQTANPPPPRPALVFPIDRDVHTKRTSPSPPIPSHRFHPDTLPHPRHHTPPSHSPATYTPPSPASFYAMPVHDNPQQSPLHRRSSSPRTFQSQLLPSFHRPAASALHHHFQQPLQPSASRAQSIPHSRSTSNPTPVSAYPISGSSPSSTSLSSPLSSSHSPHTHKSNPSFVGLDALVHVASQESRRLSVGSSASQAEKHSSVSPAMHSPLHRSPVVPPPINLPPPHWQYQHHDDKRQNTSPVLEQPTLRASTSPAFSSHPLPRYPGIPEDNFATDHRQHNPSLHIQNTSRPQRLLADIPAATDSGQYSVSGHPLYLHRSSRRERIFANEPASPVFDDKTRLSPLHLQHYPHHPVNASGSPSRHSFSQLPPLPATPHSRQWTGSDDRFTKYPDLDAQPERELRSVTFHDLERSGRSNLVGPASMSSVSHPFPHHTLVPPPIVPHHNEDAIPSSPVSHEDRILVSAGEQRRRVKGSPGVGDDRPRKKHRSANPTGDLEPVAKHEEERLQVSDTFPQKSHFTTVLIHHGLVNSDTYSSPQIPKDEEDVLLPSTEHRGRSRSKSTIADLLNADERAPERIQPQPLSVAQTSEPPKPVPQVEMSEALTENRTSPEPDREETDDLRVAVEKCENQEQDPHEWLLEHYDDSPSNSDANSHSGVVSAASAERVDDGPRASSSKAKTSEAFERELEEVAGMAVPHTSHVSDAEADVDVVTELVVETLEGADNHPVTTMDVEDELLSLVGDRPAHHISRHLPSAPSPLSQHPSSIQRASSSSSDNRGTGTAESQHISPVALAISVPSPTSHTSPAVVLQPSEASSVATPTLERGSMPPPSVPIASGSGPPKKGESGSGKKKEKAAKSALKAKPPPKPRAKPVPKLKSKGALDGAGPGPTGKGAKSGSVAATAIPSGVKKSFSSGASRSRSTSVMPHGEGESKADADEAGEEDDDDNHEDDKLYCVCRTKYEEDRVMIACDRCDEWYHTQCVNMPDLEIDLVDQFICPPCIAKHPELSLKTTYKTRCLRGLNHADPSSSEACHKPARGVFSKYCSDECGKKYMQLRIDVFLKNGESKESLWESVKHAQKREGVVVCAETGDTETDKGPLRSEKTKNEIEMDIKRAITNVLRKAKKTKTEREIDMLKSELDQILGLREQIKREMEVALWRQRLLELASTRSEKVNQCGWDQRLCFGDEEWAEFGAGVWESYETDGVKVENEEAMVNVEGAPEDEGAWWCVGKKVCERHSGWQTLRGKDVTHEIQLREESLQKLTSQEREIRKRIEDMADQDDDKKDSTLTVDAVKEKATTSKVKTNGEPSKKVKKKRIQ